MIPFALSNSNATKLTYIGHSQGTSQAFAGFIRNNTFASSNINLFVALAPVCYLGSVGSNITRFAADLYLDEIELALGIFFLLTFVTKFLFIKFIYFNFKFLIILSTLN